MIKKIYRLILNHLPKKIRIAVNYFRIFKVWPNIDEPKNFNEKILHRIIYEKDNKFSFFADKYEVRQYIEDTVGSDFLIPLLAVYENACDLQTMKNWEQVVIKPNHGAGMVKIIDSEPDHFTKLNIINEAQCWLQVNYGKIGDEVHYSFIKPKILVEKKITRKKEGLTDYKFHRFFSENGSYRQILQIISDRSEQGFETVFFDVNDLDHIFHSPFGFKLVLTEREKDCIAEIVKLNTKLCPEYDYVRLDWYITENKIYFGEITFTPGAGRSLNFSGAFGEMMGTLWEIKK